MLRFISQFFNSGIDMTVEKEAVQLEQGGDGVKDVVNESPDDNTKIMENYDGTKGENVMSSNLTKRQEMVVKSKIEREKIDEMRRLR